MSAFFKKFKVLLLGDLILLTILYLGLFFPVFWLAHSDFIVLLCLPSITLFLQIFEPMFGRFMRSRVGVNTEEIAVIVSLQAVCSALASLVPAISTKASFSQGMPFILLFTAWSTVWFLLSLTKAPLFFKAPAVGKILFYAYSIFLLLLPDIFYIQAHDEGSYSIAHILGVHFPTLILTAIIGAPLLARAIKRAYRAPVPFPLSKRFSLALLLFLSLLPSYAFTDLYEELFILRRLDCIFPFQLYIVVFPALIASVLFFIALSLRPKQEPPVCPDPFYNHSSYY